MGHQLWFTTSAILTILSFTDAPQVVEGLDFTFSALTNNTLFLLLSIAIVAFATASGADNIVTRTFIDSPVRMIGCAAPLGGLSPFCSCDVIPLIAVFIAMGFTVRRYGILTYSSSD